MRKLVHFILMDPNANSMEGFRKAAPAEAPVRNLSIARNPAGMANEVTYTVLTAGEVTIERIKDPGQNAGTSAPDVTDADFEEIK